MDKKWLPSVRLPARRSLERWAEWGTASYDGVNLSGSPPSESQTLDGSLPHERLSLWRSRPLEGLSSHGDAESQFFRTQMMPGPSCFGADNVDRGSQNTGGTSSQSSGNRSQTVGSRLIGNTVVPTLQSVNHPSMEHVARRLTFRSDVDSRMLPGQVQSYKPERRFRTRGEAPATWINPSARCQFNDGKTCTGGSQDTSMPWTRRADVAQTRQSTRSQIQEESADRLMFEDARFWQPRIQQISSRPPVPRFTEEKGWNQPNSKEDNIFGKYQSKARLFETEIKADLQRMDLIMSIYPEVATRFISVIQKNLDESLAAGLKQHCEDQSEELKAWLEGTFGEKGSITSIQALVTGLKDREKGASGILKRLKQLELSLDWTIDHLESTLNSLKQKPSIQQEQSFQLTSLLGLLSPILGEMAGKIGPKQAERGTKRNRDHPWIVGDKMKGKPIACVGRLHSPLFRHRKDGTKDLLSPNNGEQQQMREHQVPVHGLPDSDRCLPAYNNGGHCPSGVERLQLGSRYPGEELLPADPAGLVPDGPTQLSEDGEQLPDSCGQLMPAILCCSDESESIERRTVAGPHERQEETDCAHTVLLVQTEEPKGFDSDMMFDNLMELSDSEDIEEYSGVLATQGLDSPGGWRSGDSLGSLASLSSSPAKGELTDKSFDSLCSPPMDESEDGRSLLHKYHIQSVVNPAKDSLVRFRPEKTDSPYRSGPEMDDPSEQDSQDSDFSLNIFSPDDSVAHSSTEKEGRRGLVSPEYGMQSPDIRGSPESEE